MRPQYSIVTQPASEPISYDEAAEHVRVDSVDDRDYLEALIPAAREWVESITGRVGMVTTYRLTARRWCDIMTEARRLEIPLLRSPLAAVSSVKYYASGETSLTTMSADDYIVVTATTPGIVELDDGALPATEDRSDAIQIEFTAGHADAADIPALFRHAVKMLVANLYEQRSPIAAVSMQDIPWTLRGILETLKVGGHVA